MATTTATTTDDDDDNKRTDDDMQIMVDDVAVMTMANGKDLWNDIVWRCAGRIQIIGAA